MTTPVAPDSSSIDRNAPAPTHVGMHKIAARLAAVLDGRSARFSFGYWLNFGLMVLIILNVAAVILESVGWIQAAAGPWFYRFELLSVVVFSLEYVLRLWSAPELPRYLHLSPARARWRYITSGMAIIDLIAIVPFYLSIFVTLDLRFVRVLRLLRIFKFTRHSRALQILGTVLKRESGSLFAAFSVLFVLLILASSGIYLIESKVQPDKFGSIPEAMWWAMATLTTVGYGDVTPITGWGKFFGSMVTIIGMGMVALPAGILASGFAEQLAQRRDNFRMVVEALLKRAEAGDDNALLIERVRVALQIDHDTAQRIITALQPPKT